MKLGLKHSATPPCDRCPGRVSPGRYGNQSLHGCHPPGVVGRQRPAGQSAGAVRLGAVEHLEWLQFFFSHRTGIAAATLRPQHLNTYPNPCDGLNYKFTTQELAVTMSDMDINLSKNCLMGMHRIFRYIGPIAGQTWSIPMWIWWYILQ